ncbi:DsbA family protein [Actinosynnema sp. NPDC053489]|uniref:DsbA family protein n=1 Tax=Actinosynnema sp. NPDC053489 TaxID=3363916 RepID=UPI0037C85C06
MWIGRGDINPPEVVVYFDYVCPYCLLAEDAVKTAAADAGATVTWRPYELRPHPNPTLRPEDEYLPRVWRSSVHPMAERLGVPVKLPTVSPQPCTHLPFEGALFAEEHGRAEEYHGAVLRAFFQRDLDIGRPEVLRDLAAEVGLDAGEFADAPAERRYERRHGPGSPRPWRRACGPSRPSTSARTASRACRTPTNCAKR